MTTQEPQPVETNTPDASPSTEIKLKKMVKDFSALSKSIDEFIASWSQDENLRNRPDRQKLCSELCEKRNRPVEFFSVVYRIEKSTGIIAL